MSERSTRLLLNTRELTEDFFENTRLLGIMAPIPDYQFCWHLNSLLGMDFRLNHDIEIKLVRKKRDYFFSVYEYCEPTGSLGHYIYNNQFDGEYLLPEFRHLDYLWLLKGDEVKDDKLKLLTDSIRSIEKVQVVVELAQEKVRNKDHLVF
jgi:hypothetical protein